MNEIRDHVLMTERYFFVPLSMDLVFEIWCQQAVSISVRNEYLRSPSRLFVMRGTSRLRPTHRYLDTMKSSTCTDLGTPQGIGTHNVRGTNDIAIALLS